MKHFRDLVLSTKEPALHNVLWIKPDKTDLAKYWVMIYEDGWKPLFGEGGSTARGINYTVVKNLSDGYIVQLIDDSVDPDNPKNLYPKTKAKYVFLSNSIDVETAINDINNKLNSLNKAIKYAYYIDQETLDNTQYKRTQTYWVNENIRQSDGSIVGEDHLRTYTTEEEYTSTPLQPFDLIVFTNPVSEEGYLMNKLAYVVSCPLVPQGGGTYARKAKVQFATSQNYVDEAISNIIDHYIIDVKVDNESVVDSTYKVANIYKSVKYVYMINYSNLDRYYYGDAAKLGKTFYFNYGENLATSLVKYTVDGTIDIPLTDGTILYNLDMNVDYNPTTLYQYSIYNNTPILYALVTNATLPELIASPLEHLHAGITDEYATYVINLLRGYVSTQDFDNTVKATLHRYDFQWVENEMDPDADDPNDYIIPYPQDARIKTPEVRFKELWQAIRSIHTEYSDTMNGPSQIIIFKGQIAAFCNSSHLNNATGYNTATQCKVRFIGGSTAVTYTISKDTDDNNHTILRVVVSTTPL